MSDDLQAIDLSKLTAEDIKRLKIQAIERLRAAGELSLQEASHQTFGSHSDHATAPKPC